MSKSHKTEQAVTYRIYTEDKHNLKVIVDLARCRGIQDYTVFYGIGYFEGEKEHSIVIEIVGEYTDKHKILALAGDIKVHGQQQSVLVTTSNVFVNEI